MTPRGVQVLAALYVISLVVAFTAGYHSGPTHYIGMAPAPTSERAQEQHKDACAVVDQRCRDAKTSTLYPAEKAVCEALESQVMVAIGEGRAIDQSKCGQLIGMLDAARANRMEEWQARHFPPVPVPRRPDDPCQLIAWHCEYDPVFRNEDASFFCGTFDPLAWQANDCRRELHRRSGAIEALSTATLCGSPDASFDVTAIQPGDWDRWRCSDQLEAADQWHRCLPRSSYSPEPMTGCPGSQKCCPPALTE